MKGNLVYFPADTSVPGTGDFLAGSFLMSQFSVLSFLGGYLLSILLPGS